MVERERVSEYPVKEIDKRFFYFLGADGFVYRTLRKGSKKEGTAA